mgnify:CR=1 FL=1
MSESLETGSTIGIINATDPNNDVLEFLVFPNNADPDGDGNLAFRTSGNILIVNDSDDFDYDGDLDHDDDKMSVLGREKCLRNDCDYDCDNDGRRWGRRL